MTELAVGSSSSVVSSTRIPSPTTCRSSSSSNNNNNNRQQHACTPTNPIRRCCALFVTDGEKPNKRKSRQSSLGWTTQTSLSLRLWSVVWLSLCIGLVRKHWSMIWIFYSFTGCFLLAMTLSMLSPGALVGWAAAETTSSTTLDNNKNSAGQQQTRRLLLILLDMAHVHKDLIGLLVCWIATYYATSSSTGTARLVGWCQRTMLLLCPPVSGTYLSWSVVAGYLAFDPWYSAWYCGRTTQNHHHHHQQQPPRPTIPKKHCDHRHPRMGTVLAQFQLSSPLRSAKIFTHMEQAATLTLILMVLVWIPNDDEMVPPREHPYNHRHHSHPLAMMYQPWVVRAWAVYRVTRILHNAVAVIAAAAAASSIEQPPLVSLQARSVKPSSTARISTLATTSTSATDFDTIHHSSYPTKADGHKDWTRKDNKHHTCPSNDYWSIHGDMYNLSSFLHRHPGGRAALLLGQGRDCTALFESYHPFTVQHRRILSQFRVVRPKDVVVTDGHPDRCETNSSSSSSSDQSAISQDSSSPNDPDPPALSSSSFSPAASTPRHLQQPPDRFYQVMRERVEDTLRVRHQIDPVRDRAGNRARWCQYIVVGVVTCVTLRFHIRGSVLASFLLAVLGWFCGALGHDAGHFAASRRPWINEIGLWAMSLLSNPVVWQHQHTYAHHSYTNSFDRDPDLHHFDTLLRVHRRFKHSNICRYQSNWLFVSFAYLFVVFGTCVWIPLGILKEGTLYGMVQCINRRQLGTTTLLLFLHWILYLAIIMVVPFRSLPWYQAIMAVLLHLGTSGLIFAVFSQINHLNEASLLHDDNNDDEDHPWDETGKLGKDTIDLPGYEKASASGLTDAYVLRDSWAVRQVQASNNFCPQSRLWYYLSNGLNLQIEHHLFPGLNHCHLMMIQPTVQQVCLEFGVSYKCYNSWYDVMHATLQWLDRLSTEP